MSEHAKTCGCRNCDLSRIEKLESENARLRAIIDTLTSQQPATASLAVFLCSKCASRVDTIYEVGSGANVEHVCKNCVDALALGRRRR